MSGTRGTLEHQPNGVLDHARCEVAQICGSRHTLHLDDLQKSTPLRIMLQRYAPKVPPHVRRIVMQTGRSMNAAPSSPKWNALTSEWRAWTVPGRLDAESVRIPGSEIDAIRHWLPWKASLAGTSAKSRMRHAALCPLVCRSGSDAAASLLEFKLRPSDRRMLRLLRLVSR